MNYATWQQWAVIEETLPTKESGLHGVYEVPLGKISAAIDRFGRTVLEVCVCQIHPVDE